MIRSTLAAAAIAASVMLALAAPACADSYPDHPIMMIVPLAPGGSTDTLGRIIAQAISKTLGQPVVVENVSGAAGVIGVTRAERAAPDGYTVLWGMWG
ncbi:MAG: tripartite tricarboxylate transporter substrate-binding protein, partial [Xanthobacteraceae bacterium]